MPIAYKPGTRYNIGDINLEPHQCGQGRKKDDRRGPMALTATADDHGSSKDHAHHTAARIPVKAACMVPEPLIRSSTWEAVIMSRAEGKNMARVAKAAPITPLILYPIKAALIRMGHGVT